MTARPVRHRLRRPDAARVLLAIFLIVLTALVAMLGTPPEAGAREVETARRPVGRAHLSAADLRG